MSPHSPDTVDRVPRPPRRIALLSDTHGNLPAFEAVLADVAAEGVDETWCLGDLVGYGAQPDECVELARERCDLCLTGNHDLVVIDELQMSSFSTNAAAAADWTRRRIGEETAEFLRRLSPEDASREVALYHASPRDPVWEYVLSTLAAELCFDEMEARVAAIGHTHVALWFHRNGDASTVGAQAPAGFELELADGQWMINPGSVGQPRDGDPRAAWLLLDLDSWTATWRRIEYPIDAAAGAIRDAGLPTALAERLYYGH